MSSDLALSVRRVSKSYSIQHNSPQHTTLREAIVHGVRQPRRRVQREEFWAVDDVSLDVRQGEVLGVIGRNGAGKSTLLKVLSRVTAPTKGEVHVYGRIGSLLEVGTGFHPELTGRENIYLNGSILGMRRREIRLRFDEIVAFAGVERFLDTPVKRYSSGMYVRLAFAVAAHLDTDVLLVDEVLSVGDAEFQAKCLSKVGDLGGSGRTVLLVSHNLSAIRQFATQACLMENGTITHHGGVTEVLGAYAGSIRASGVSARLGAWVLPDGAEAEIADVEIVGGPRSAEESLTYVAFAASRFPAAYQLSHTIRRDSGEAVASGISRERVQLRGGSIEQIIVKTELPRLAPGDYLLTVALSLRTAREPVCYLADAAHFEVVLGTGSGALEQIWDPSWGSIVLEPPSVEIMETDSAQKTET